MDAGILIIFLCSFIIVFCAACLCCSIFSDNEEEIRNLERRQQGPNQAPDAPYVVEMEQIKKPTTITPIKSPVKSKASSCNEEIPPPSYEEWLHMSGQVTPNI
ncbi:hypothetical protein ACKWTF_011032 [Chironomus riparius]